jgi:hypothetical protein
LQHIIALLFATSNYTYAQFGGLLNAAKKKAQEKVEKAVDKKAKEQADPQRNLPKSDKPQRIVARVRYDKDSQPSLVANLLFILNVLLLFFYFASFIFLLHHF